MSPASPASSGKREAVQLAGCGLDGLSEMRMSQEGRLPCSLVQGGVSPETTESDE